MFWGKLLDAVLPPRCPACGEAVEAAHAFCPACWKDLDFLAPPLCRRCGGPVEAAGLTCAPCLAQPPAVAVARAAFDYAGAPARAAILAFKHGDRPELAPSLARHMARAGAEALDGADWLLPVPLHRWRLLRRRFNQSALLAQALGRLTGLDVAVDGLILTKATPPQQGLSREERSRNVRRAFELNPRWRERLAGKTAVLIDDVATTGATLEACAAVLLKCGVAKVNALTIARVV